MKKHESKFWNQIAAVRGRRSYKGHRKLLKAWTTKTQVIDGFRVKLRSHAPKSKAMKHIQWWI
jgi:hypothetical protein